jgi:hypothetical protein
MRKASGLEDKNEPLAARKLYVSLDRADNVIEGVPNPSRCEGFGF